MWLKAPQQFKGYVDESLNKNLFDEDNFFCTGDIVRIDEGGNVIIVGRQKDIIIRKGENVAPLEVENLLLKHPKVADVAVIGLETDIGGRGELACAVVVPAGEERITLEEIGAFLGEAKLSKRKWPEQLEFLDALPKTPTGKIEKLKKLKPMFTARLPEKV